MAFQTGKSRHPGGMGGGGGEAQLLAAGKFQQKV